MSSKKSQVVTTKMSSKNSQIDIDTKSLKQRQQAEFYAISVKESNTVVKTKPPTVQEHLEQLEQDIKSTRLSQIS